MAGAGGVGEETCGGCSLAALRKWRTRAALQHSSRRLPACGPRRRAAAQHGGAAAAKNFSRSAARESFDTATAFGDPALNTVHASHGQPERASHGRSRRKLNLRQRCG